MFPVKIAHRLSNIYYPRYIRLDMMYTINVAFSIASNMTGFQECPKGPTTELARWLSTLTIAKVGSQNRAERNFIHP